MNDLNYEIYNSIVKKLISHEDTIWDQYDSLTRKTKTGNKLYLYSVSNPLLSIRSNTYYNIKYFSWIW